MRIKTNSLKTSILLIVIVTMIAASALSMIVAFESGKNAVKQSFLDQLFNANKGFDFNIANYYDEHMKLARYLAKDTVIIEAARTRNISKVESILKNFYNEKGTLEDVFISTPEENATILVCGSPRDSKVKGMKWRGTGFDENIDNALMRKEFTSKPYLSPGSGRVVVLITVPIIDSQGIAGILGMPFDFETYSVTYLKTAKIGTEGYIFLTNLEGMTIAHPTKENIFNLDLKKYKWGIDAFKSLENAREGENIAIDYEWENRDKILTATRNKKLGYIVFSTMYMDDIQKKIKTMQTWMFIIGFVSVLIALSIIYWFVNRRFKPLKQAIDRARDLSEGEADLTKRIMVTVQDEIGEMAGYFNKFIERIQKIIVQVKENTENISSASAEFSSVSAQMAQASEQTRTQSSNVASATEQVSSNISNIASAAEEMSVNISTVSSTAEQMSQNMVTVASSTEEMSASINHIAQNAREASKVADKAVSLATESTRTMNALGIAAEEIGKVTEVIKRIADKTNLLALNATIEAASAGDAGRGFAVVANEIKELANQSAQAAEDIANRIKGVQGNTTDAVKIIDNVASIIKTINEAVIIITNSVEQQSAAANDISSNVLEAKSGVNNIANAVTELSKAANDMSVNAGEAAKGSNEVSGSIALVNKSAIENNNSAKQVSQSSEDLSKIAQMLLEIVNRFKLASS